MGKFVGATNTPKDADSTPRLVTPPPGPELSKKFTWWLEQTLSFHYTPYPVHFGSVNGTNVAFTFINNDTGNPVGGEHLLDTSNLGLVHAALPSIVPNAGEFSEGKVIGLLFINQKLMTAQMSADASLALTGAEEKWPKTAEVDSVRRLLQAILQTPNIRSMISPDLLKQIDALPPTFKLFAAL
ncbi:MAG TPA: hypothetical protein VLM79_19990 [Kofleriaceae bacterium]|nr:hypothetical protein [Kofleriaceae bacterium]